MIVPQSEPRVPMAQILAEMELLSHGSVTAWNKAGSTVPDSREPSGETRPPHEYWRKRHEEAFDREKVRCEAQAALGAWRTRQVRVVQEETLVERDARMLDEGRGWAAKEVALRFNCTPSYVERARRCAALDAQGVALKRIEAKAPAERAERGRRMRGEGKSLRQIAWLLGCDPMTVQRDLRRAKLSAAHETVVL